MAKQNKKPIRELAKGLTKDLPEEVLANLPSDGATNHDKYLNESVDDVEFKLSQDIDDHEDVMWDRLFAEL